MASIVLAVGTGAAVSSVNGRTGAVTGLAESADVVHRVVYTAGAYPARPSGIAAGLVEYVGPVQPTTWLAGDTWIQTA